MTVRRLRGASLGVVGALAAGLLLAPSGGATAAGSDGPDFYPVDAVSVAPTGGAARLVAADGVSSSDTGQRRMAKSVTTAKNLQIVQRMTGTTNIGDQGLSVAAGPKHVMQVGGDRTRVLNKRTGGVVNTKQLGQAIGVTGATEGTVVYDPLARRWFLAAVTDDLGDVGLVLRVSKGTKPTKWQPPVVFANATTGDSNSDVTESRPAIGTSSNKVVITTLADDGDTPANVNRIFFFPKQPLMNGNAPSPWVADLNNTYNGQRPAVNASTENNIFVAIPDTDDVTVTTYTGGATTSAPNFSKNVVYPTRGDMTVPPIIDQGSGDDLSLGPLAFSGVSWRSGKLFAAATGDCSDDACIRLIGVGTEAGVTLIEDEKITNPLVGNEVFSPSVAIDGNGYVHLAATTVESGSGGPSLAALALTKIDLGQEAGSNLKARFVKRSTAVFNDNGATGTVDWYNSTGAAIDPTSPWDVWVTGAISTSSSNPNLETSIARISMARSVVTVKSSSNRVRKGNKATLSIKVSRPQSKDTIAGQSVVLQRRPATGGSWRQVGTGSTDPSGIYSKRIKITKNVQFRGVLRKVQQLAGEGVVYDRVNSKAVAVRLR